MANTAVKAHLPGVVWNVVSTEMDTGRVNPASTFGSVPVKSMAVHGVFIDRSAAMDCGRDIARGIAAELANGLVREMPDFQGPGNTAFIAYRAPMGRSEMIAVAVNRDSGGAGP